MTLPASGFPWLARKAPKAVLRSFTERDPEENLTSRPPEGERVELQSIWLAECYGPATVSGLQQGLSRLGWLTNRPLPGGSDIDPAQLVAGARSWVFSSTWSEIGLIHRPRWKGWRGGWAIESTLPEGIEVAWASLFTPVAPLTILVMQFMLEEGADALIQRELERERRTTAHPSSTGWLFETPRGQKEKGVRSAIHELEDRCSTWLTSRFPGGFAGGIGDGHLPSARLILVDQAEPLYALDQSSGYGSWIRIAGLSGDEEAWGSLAMTGLRLKVPKQPQSRREGNALTLAGKRASVYSDARLGADGTPGRWELAQWARESFDGTMAFWSTIQYLRGQQEQMAGARDLDEEQRRTRRRLLRRARTLQEALRLGRDGELVATELQGQTLESLRFLSAEFNPVKPKGAQEDDLLTAWQGLVSGEAQAYLARQSALNENLTSDVQLLQSQASLAVQRVVFWLSIIATAIALVGLGITVASDDSESAKAPASTAER